MILYIEDTFSAIGEIPLDDGFDDEFLKECSIYFNTKQVAPNKVELTIYPQKVGLDEVSMNTLFDMYLNNFDYIMEYGGYGGVGCPFSISLRKDKQKCH